MKDYIDIKHTPKILWIIFAIGFIIRILFSISTEYSIIHGILSDDSFYYFRIAQNISNGFGSSFDQITKTNGYQPLVMIPLIAIYLILSTSDILTPIVVSQIFLTIVNLISAMMTYTLMVKLSKGSKVSAIFSLVVLYLNPIFIAINFKSLETNLYWLFLVWSLLYFIKNFDLNIPLKDFLLGILIAFSALSRLDGGFLMIAFAIYFLMKSGVKLFERIKKVFFVGIGFSVLFVPYMLYNQLAYGNVVPISGQAKIFHNHRAVLENVGSYWSIDFLLYEIKRFFFPVDFNQLLERGFGPLEKILVIVGFVLLGVFLIYLWRIKLLQSVWNKFSNLKFFFLFILLHYSYYTLYFWEYRFYYFLPQILLLTFIIGVFIEEIILKFTKNISQVEFKWDKLSAIVFALIILFNLFIGYRQLNAVHGQTLVYKAGLWIKENIEDDPVMSSANAGIISYFSQKRIINLDGMVNNSELLNAFARGDEAYFGYLKKYKVEYLCDYLGNPPTNKYFFPSLLNDKYKVVREIKDERLKYQILKDYVILKLKL